MKYKDANAKIKFFYSVNKYLKIKKMLYYKNTIIPINNN